MRPVHDRAAPREAPPWWVLAVHAVGRWMWAHPVAAVVVVLVLVWWQTGAWLWPVVAVAVVAVGIWQRQRLAVRRRGLALRTAWRGTAGRMGQAAAMGLVSRDHQIPEVSRYIETERGRTLTLVCPAGVAPARVVDAADDLCSLWGAVAITPEVDTAARTVTIHLVDRDATAETVEAPWVTAIDDAPPLPEATTTEDASPWWETDQPPSEDN